MIKNTSETIHTSLPSKVRETSLYVFRQTKHSEPLISFVHYLAHNWHMSCSFEPRIGKVHLQYRELDYLSHASTTFEQFYLLAKFHPHIANRTHNASTTFSTKLCVSCKTLNSKSPQITIIFS